MGKLTLCIMLYVFVQFQNVNRKIRKTQLHRRYVLYCKFNGKDALKIVTKLNQLMTGRYRYS